MFENSHLLINEKEPLIRVESLMKDIIKNARIKISTILLKSILGNKTKREKNLSAKLFSIKFALFIKYIILIYPIF